MRDPDQQRISAASKVGAPANHIAPAPTPSRAPHSSSWSPLLLASPLDPFNATFAHRSPRNQGEIKPHVSKRTDQAWSAPAAANPDTDAYHPTVIRAPGSGTGQRKWEKRYSRHRSMNTPEIMIVSISASHASLARKGRHAARPHVLAERMDSGLGPRSLALVFRRPTRAAASSGVSAAGGDPQFGSCMAQRETAPITPAMMR